MQPKSPSPRSRARREDDAHELLLESGRRGRVEEVRRARAFAQVDASKHYSFLGCASVGEYGLRIGFGSQHARQYAAAGRVLALCKTAEDLLLAGQVSVSTLAIIEPFFVEDELRPRDPDGEPQSNEAILKWAKVLPDRQLRRIVDQARFEARTGERPAIRVLHFTAQGVEDLYRTQDLVSRKSKRPVSQSEAAECALRFYVEKNDFLEVQPGKRRLPQMPPRTDGTTNPRSTPAEVRRAHMAKHGDVCAIEFCEHRIFLEDSHHLPLSEGGGNETPDKERICSGHHRMEDHGEIRWVPNAKESGGGHYVTLEGDILRLKPTLSPTPKPKPTMTPSRKPPEVLEDPPDSPGDRVEERAPPLLATRRDPRSDARLRPVFATRPPARSWRHATPPRRA